ncbi:Aspartate aminotransferase [Levilactobacillus zymae]|uniref:Aspartate aminotransferase n=1 Tax=Levilactobacillus zymae TaxID=267363 RepID=A0A1Y6K0C5_9LACO|nr:Aspartate aminotransferase [Levilactobacillus zymae]
MVNTILKEADLFCPNSVRINFTIYQFVNELDSHISPHQHRLTKSLFSLVKISRD